MGNGPCGFSSSGRQTFGKLKGVRSWNISWILGSIFHFWPPRGIRLAFEVGEKERVKVLAERLFGLYGIG